MKKENTAVEVASDSMVCSVPPAGWICSRPAGHEGPCAARTAMEGVNKAWVVAHPGTATGIINMLAQQIDDLTAAPHPAVVVPGDLMKKYRLTWQEAEAICVRDEVDEALREFVHDSTGDNAIGLARLIIETWLRYPSTTKKD